MSLRSSRFQSSPALWGRCNLFGVVHDTTPIPVSILTGPLGPVQPAKIPVDYARLEEFQSSPALWGRCNFPPPVGEEDVG